ncbi:sensor histidine kinase [Novosphingobium profundi]|uniref:sensor histidine kinase n=1 Tax=Novosphingobium profundi TaxID=1774954 RepID=UPI001BD9D3D4|nr:PAS domain-containing sensor histidine kinase [Novosphingobium profundi]MBT0671530.1 sensor histidine kinase [Novosphingobium profundi]
MREQVDAFDWNTTPLGPRATWPSELEIVVRQILDSSFPKAIVWGSGFTTIYNDAFVPILGEKHVALGRSFAEIWSESWSEIGPIAGRAYAGEPTYIEDFPLVINRTGQDEQAWFTFCYSPLRLADGSIRGMMDTVIETTDTVRAQASLALVNEELGHRLKNTLALVQAIASQTLRGAAEPSAIENFNHRLSALGHAHDILLQQDWASASLREIIDHSLEPHDPGSQIIRKGPNLAIGSRAAVALSLMLHELATNAAKYGALSVADGCVRLSWTIDGDHLDLRWHESDGPPVTAPTAKGFGSRLIAMGLGRSSEVELRYEATGFKLDMRTPIAKLAS